MRRTRAHLADGREILYFDSDGAPERELRDPRDLPPVASALELRHDPVIDVPVAIASHRQERTHLPADDQCPLCPSRDGRQTEIPASSYEVVAFENRFPSFTPETTGGRCEVVCFTDQHDSSFAELEPARARLVVDAWADRTEALNALPSVEQVFVFENRGDEIGATLRHPHGQIYAYPFVTPRTRRMLEAGATPVAREELVVAERGGWRAFVPEAARWPYEVHLYPRFDAADLPALEPAERDDLAAIYLDLLGGFARLFSRPAPYIAAWHQAPSPLHLELFTVRRDEGKLKYLAGSESAMEVWINDVRPEDAAERLRQAISRAPSAASQT